MKYLILCNLTYKASMYYIYVKTNIDYYEYDTNRTVFISRTRIETSRIKCHNSHFHHPYMGYTV